MRGVRKWNKWGSDEANLTHKYFYVFIVIRLCGCHEKNAAKYTMIALNGVKITAVRSSRYSDQITADFAHVR